MIEPDTFTCHQRVECRNIGPHKCNHVDRCVHFGGERIDFIAYLFQAPFQPADAPKGKIGNFCVSFLRSLPVFPAARGTR